MKKKIRFALVILTVMAFAMPLAAAASIAGRFTLVTGKVDLLKQGKLPAVAAKVKDGVESGDIIRTKSRSKAQLTMVDASVITLAPGSRLAIADYQYNPARQERRAVLRFFRGLMQTTVKHIIQREEPDFVVETHTAVIGVRGSNPYFLLRPGFTSVYLPQGLLEVRSNVPSIPYQAMVYSMQFTQIPLAKQPLLPKPLTPAMLTMLEKMMNTGISPGDLYSGAGSAPASKGEEFPIKLPVSPEQMIRLQTIPPTIMPQPQAPAPTPHQPLSPGGG